MSVLDFSNNNNNQRSKHNTTAVTLHNSYIIVFTLVCFHLRRWAMWFLGSFPMYTFALGLSKQSYLHFSTTISTPYSTGLITFSPQFRCGTQGKQCLIDMSSSLTMAATQHQGCCFCWHCLSPPLKAMPLWTQPCIIGALCHTIQQISALKVWAGYARENAHRGREKQVHTTDLILIWFE